MRLIVFLDACMRLNLLKNSIMLKVLSVVKHYNTFIFNRKIVKYFSISGGLNG